LNHFIEYANKCPSRLLSLVNTSEYSESYGSFDKSYWHFKTSDFSNAAKQQGILPLAKFYLFNSSENSLFKNDKVLSIIEGSIIFCEKIQHSDGSFDEWYVNERGWAGPTGYLIYALSETYILLGDHLRNKAKNSLKKIFNKSKEHLILSDEKHPLANHIAIAMLAIFNLSLIDSDPRLEKRYQILLNELEQLFNFDEGWSVEYDGPDPGYQSATVSFLSRIHKHNKCERIEVICMKSLKFLENFCYPDGTFSEVIGSRHTTNIFYYGIEYWNSLQENPISGWVKNNFSSQTLPLDHGDNYFLYRVHELFDAGQVYKDSSHLPLTYYSKMLPEAGIEIIFDSSNYIVLNRYRGHVFKCFSKNKLVAYDSGIIIKSDNTLFTNLWISKTGSYFKIKEKHFKPLTFILFRLFFIIFARNRRIAYFLKNSIKQILIFGKKEAPFLEKNEFKYNGTTITITKEFFTKNRKNYEITFGKKFFTRYVPQSSLFNVKKVDHLTEKSQSFNCTGNTKIIIIYDINKGLINRELIN